MKMTINSTYGGSGVKHCLSGDDKQYNNKKQYLTSLVHPWNLLFLFSYEKKGIILVLFSQEKYCELRISGTFRHKSTLEKEYWYFWLQKYVIKNISIFNTTNFLKNENHIRHLMSSLRNW